MTFGCNAIVLKNL